jgi:HlyD family secretion protein
MVDIARPESVKREKKIRRILYATSTLVVVAGISFGASRLSPAVPAVARPEVWIDTVKRGPLIRQVRGSGTLVPENIRWITATTSGRVEKRVLRPGATVMPTTVILIMSNPDLRQAATTAELAWKSSQAALENRRAQLQTDLLTQEAALGTAQSNANQAALTLAAKEQLYREELISTLELRQFRGQAAETKNRERIAQKQLEIAKAGIRSQIAPQEADVNQKRAAYDLVLTQLEALNVKAGMHGVLQLLPVEEGAAVAANAPVARVADPTVLKAELRIAETQIKDVKVGQVAEVDTRNGVVAGKVTRIDPAAANGTVGVEVSLEGALPPGARPDLSVDGTVRLEKLDDVIFVARPAFGQEESTIQLFKVLPNGEAHRTKVLLGRSSVIQIEIREGLQPGDQVILSDMSSYDQFDRLKVK